jgi:hypothetical protein
MQIQKRSTCEKAYMILEKQVTKANKEMEVTVPSPSKQGFAPYLDLGGGETKREK